MKRLGIYIITSVMLFGMFGGFVLPEKGYAQASTLGKNGESCSTPSDCESGICNSNDGQVFVCMAPSAIRSEKLSTIEQSSIINTLIDTINSVPNIKSTNSGLSLLQKHTSMLAATADDPNGIGIAYKYFRDDITSGTSYYTALAEVSRRFGQYLASETKTEKTYLTVGIPFTNIATSITNGAISDNDIIISEFAAVNNLYIATKGAQDILDEKLTPEQAATKLANAQKRNAELSKPLSDSGDCSVGITSWAGLSCMLTSFIKIFLMNIAGFLVWASANMLNYSIQVGILNFSQWAPESLYPIWIIMRQIVSLFIIFAGLWLGLMYIIGKDEKFEKYIPWVVIFALFVNFSYPLVRTTVDISNMVSLNIYASTVGSNALTADSSSKDTAGAQIMSKLGLQGLVMSATGDSNANSNMLTSVSSPAGALMAVVFILYAAYILFMVTALVVVRTAVLVFLIVASPILFVDSVIPKLGEKAQELRKMLFEQLAVGPIFMIMFAITLKFLDVFKTAGGSGGGADNSIKEFFNIMIMLVMLHIMLKVTKATAGSIGETATGWMGKVGGFAMGGAAGMALGGAGMLARGTIGKRAAAMAKSDTMNSWVNKTGVGGFVGRHAYNLTNSVAKSSFDGRNSSYVQAGATKLGLSHGMGTGSKLGYEEAAQKKQDNLKNRFTNIKTINKDGTVNQSGLEARQKFLDGQSSSFKSSVANDSEDEAIAINTKIDKDKKDQLKDVSHYNEGSMAFKKIMYDTEKNKDTKEMMVAQDFEAAQAENVKRDERKESIASKGLLGSGEGVPTTGYTKSSGGIEVPVNMKSSTSQQNNSAGVHIVAPASPTPTPQKSTTNSSDSHPMTHNIEFA